MTGIEVAQNALMNINSYKYLYGAKGEVATSAQIESLITAYPSHFNTDSRKSAARAKAGYRCIDCSGYVCLSMGMRSIGSWQLYETAAQKLTMHFTNNKWMAGGTYIPYGAVLWKPGHVGIYVGNQQSAEAVSEESDLQINNIDGRGFTHALLFDEGAFVIDYAANQNDAALSVPASLVQPGYIPWIGKIINAEEVVPKIAPDGTAPDTYFGALHNGEQIRVTGLYGDYYHVENDNGFRGYINSYYIGNLNAPAYDSGYITWTGQVFGADNHVNVRIAPRTTAALHGTFPELLNGTQVRVTGETLGTEDLRLWYQVTLSDNSTAFIRADLVNPVVISNYTAWNGKAQSTTGTVNIRSAATVNSSLSQLHAPLSNGDSVTVTGETMGSDGYRWYSVSIDGTAVGYCRCDLIVPAYEDYYEEWYATIQTGTGSGNLRVGPGTNYNTVTGSPFANGTLVHIEGEADGADGYVWYQLTELSGYRRGYIRADLVQAAANYPNWAVYAETVTGTLNIRSGPGTGFALSNVVSSVSNGRELTVISQTLGTDLKIWYQVKVDGVTAGYVRSDLVVHAGDTIGDNPYTVVSWQGRMVTNQAVNVYDYPMATEEASYPVPMGTYFLISEKVFDSNGGVWYHGTAEDGVVDQNNNPVSGFIRESEVKVFPKATECQNDNDTHEYYYPDGNVLEECSKWGKHVRFLKADREMEDLFHLDLTEGKSIGIANSVIYGNLDLLIDIEDMIDILYDIESAYYDYCTDNDLIFTKENMVYAICAAIRKGHYDDFKWDIVLAFQSYSQSFADYIDTRESELKAEYKRIILGEVSRGGNIVNRKIYVLSAGNVVIDWRHMIATMLGYSMDIPIVPKPWYGWAADAATFADNVSQAVGSQYEYAMSNLFNSEEAGSGSFSYQDLMADVDAIGVSELISEAMLENNGSSDQHVLSYVLSEYFSSPYLLSLRKTRLMQDVFWNNTVSYDINEFSDAIYYSLYRNHPLGTAVNVLFGDTPPQECNVLYMNHYHGGDDSVRIVSNVMAKYILSENASFGSEY